MCSRLVVAVVCLFAFVGRSPAADPVPGLIEELASGDYRTREAATKQLEALGEPALDALKKAAKTHPDPEAARRATELVARIGKKVDTEKTLAPTLVELAFHEQPVGDVVDAIEKQTGYKLAFADITLRQKLVTLKTEGKVPFWSALEMLGDAAKLEATTTDFGVPNVALPTGRGSNPYRVPTPSAVPPAGIVLRERTGERKPSFVRGAVRITVTMLPHAAYATYPKDTIPVAIVVQPEPKLRWERVLAVGILKAKDDGGQELIALSSQDAAHEGLSQLMPGMMPVRGGNIVIGPNGAILVPNRGPDPFTANGFQSLPTHGLARLKAGAEPTKSLTALQGTVRGTVRTAPEELAVVAGLELAKNAAPVRGPNGVALNVTGFVAKADSPEYEIDATVAYNPLDVQVADSSGMPIAQETIMVQGGGGRIIRRQVRGGFDIDASGTFPPQLHLAGLTVTDAEGRPFLLNAVSYRRLFDAEGRTTDSIKLTVKPSDKTSGKPVAVAFRASRSKTIEVPFDLANVAVANGLGPVAPGVPPR